VTAWPALDPARDAGTWRLLHLAAQMLGKLRVAHAAWVNHGWHVALQPAVNGLSMLPIAVPGGRFALSLDLCDHQLHLSLSDGRSDAIPLAQPSVAKLHAGLIAMLERNGLPSHFHGTPHELPDALAFAGHHRPVAQREDIPVRLRAGGLRKLAALEAARSFAERPHARREKRLLPRPRGGAAAS